MVSSRNARPKQSFTPRASLGATLGLVGALIVATGLAACEGCRLNKTATPSPPPAAVETPNVRLWMVSDVAGALEPCGCVRDQLGGVGHLAALFRNEQKMGSANVLVSAGPLFFTDPVIAHEREFQDHAKADTLASLLKDLRFKAFAPGRNDWAEGAERLRALAAQSGGVALASNVKGFAAMGSDAGPPVQSTVVEANGIPIGFVGVADPNGAPMMPPLAGVEVTSPAVAVRAEVDALRSRGARVLIVLAAVGRGEAKRIADAVPDLTAILVGSSSSRGETNTQAPAPEHVGTVLIVEMGNHLQNVGWLDLYVRTNSLAFADASGIEELQKRDEIARRIQELHVRIAVCEHDGKVSKDDLDARRSDLRRLEAAKNVSDRKPPPPAGNFYRFSTKDIRESLGSDPSATDILGGYYKSINDQNRIAFSGRLPRPAEPGHAAYVGVDVCSTCHSAARTFWNTTRHAGAYKTLSSQSKEFNLDCVGCHVTGYDEPGGSTVTHAAGLTDVQCESCHGPGSLHAKDGDPKLIVGRPSPTGCVTCHHPPHVHEFDPVKAVPAILGPGHGRPLQ